MRAMVMALALAACASPAGEGVVSTRDGMNVTDAAKVGDGAWLVTCQRLSDCTRRAAAVCPSGFDLTPGGQSQQTSGAIGPYGGGFGSRPVFTVQVLCKA